MPTPTSRRPFLVRSLILLALPAALALAVFALFRARPGEPAAAPAAAASPNDEVAQLRGELQLLRRQMQVVSQQQAAADRRDARHRQRHRHPAAAAADRGGGGGARPQAVRGAGAQAGGRAGGPAVGPGDGAADRQRAGQAAVQGHEAARCQLPLDAVSVRGGSTTPRPTAASSAAACPRACPRCPRGPCATPRAATARPSSMSRGRATRSRATTRSSPGGWSQPFVTNKGESDETIATPNRHPGRRRPGRLVARSRRQPRRGSQDLPRVVLSPVEHRQRRRWNTTTASTTAS